jgi:molecular chaperone DnaK (HSP70)
LRKLRFIYHLLLLITGPKHIEKNWQETFFEKLCEKLISRCRIPVEKALTDARLDKADINEVC